VECFLVKFKGSDPSLRSPRPLRFDESSVLGLRPLFRRGLADIQSQINISDVYSTNYKSSSYTSSKSSSEYDDYEAASAPKFEPPPAEPQAETAPEPAADAAPEEGTQPQHG